MQEESKGPRKRSNRKRYGSQLPGLTGRPFGKAKRKLLERLDVEEEELESVRDQLKIRLDQERGISTTWTKTKEFLENQKKWNSGVLSPSKESDEDDIVGDTNVFEWKQVKDPESGDVYFWNINTDETTWDIPEGVEIQQEQRESSGFALRKQQDIHIMEFSLRLLNVQAKDADIYITGLRTGRLLLSLIWFLLGQWDAFGFPRQVKRSVEGVNKLLPSISELDENPELYYGPLPLTEVIHVPAGQTVSVAVWCDDLLGIILRKKDPWMNNGRRRTRRYIGGFFDKGEVTDENVDMTVRCGLVPTEASQLR
eukprot:767409-Hanusia_phi.AAC.4